ncbi:hypothetical protein [Psychrobacter frigidicola]|uniref:hypothetical protein n=1 Tax=Psychrobacter frigidicola TaxID=45611 RepID=UPI0014783BCD|nr:hypothetical protein [Psychrobacter frigidicola]
MSTNNDDTSDIKQAADNVNVQQIEKNLQDKKQTDKPEPLTEEQATPFIDAEVRTDD